jgi:hypothetical protein
MSKSRRDEWVNLTREFSLSRASPKNASKSAPVQSSSAPELPWCTAEFLQERHELSISIRKSQRPGKLPSELPPKQTQFAAKKKKTSAAAINWGLLRRHVRNSQTVFDDTIAALRQAKLDGVLDDTYGDVGSSSSDEDSSEDDSPHGEFWHDVHKEQNKILLGSNIVVGDHSSPTKKYLTDCSRLMMRPELGVTKLWHPGDDNGVNLSAQGLGNIRIEAMAESMSAAPNSRAIAAMNLSDNRLSKAGVVAMIRQLNPLSLSSLDLSHNALGNEGLAEILKLMEGSKTLTCLNLENTSIGDFGVEKLCHLVVYSSLKSLNLSHCQLHSRGRGAPAIASMIGSGGSNQLTTLSLSWCKLTGAAAKSVVQAVGTAKTIEILDLSWNVLGAGTVPELAEALAKNDSLTHLDLSHNQIDAAGTVVLGEGLAQNHTLCGLHVDGNLAEVDARGFLLPPEAVHEFALLRTGGVPGWTPEWAAEQAALAEEAANPGKGGKDAKGKGGKEKGGKGGTTAPAASGAAAAASGQLLPPLGMTPAVLNLTGTSPLGVGGAAVSPSLYERPSTTQRGHLFARPCAPQVVAPCLQRPRARTPLVDEWSGHNCCWICERWRKVLFVWQEGKDDVRADGDNSLEQLEEFASTSDEVAVIAQRKKTLKELAKPVNVFFRCAVDHWHEEAMQKGKNGSWTCTRMMPPGDLQFSFIVHIGAPPNTRAVALAAAGPAQEVLHLPQGQSYATAHLDGRRAPAVIAAELAELDPAKPETPPPPLPARCNVMRVRPRFEDDEIEVPPRTLGKAQSVKKKIHHHKWTFAESVFYPYRQDTKMNSSDAFDEDWQYCTVQKGIKDPEQLELCREVLKERYYEMKAMFKQYASTSTDGFTMALNAFSDWVNDCKIADNLNCNLAKMDMLFIGVNMTGPKVGACCWEGGTTLTNVARRGPRWWCEASAVARWRVRCGVCACALVCLCPCACTRACLCVMARALSRF